MQIEFWVTIQKERRTVNFGRSFLEPRVHCVTDSEDDARWDQDYYTKEYGAEVGPARAVRVVIEVPDDLLDERPVPTATTEEAEPIR